MSPALLTISKWGSAAPTASPVVTAPGGDHMEDSTPTPPENAREDEYAALIKPGDAIETPDGELWVVDVVGDQDLGVTSASTDSAGQICADVYELTRTTVPKQLAHKVADARRVRRP